MPPVPSAENPLSKGLLDVLIRAGLVAILAVVCYRIFHPFLNLMLWSMILGVILYPLQRHLKSKLANKDGRTATVIVILAVGIFLVPIYLLGTSMASSVEHAITTIRTGGLHVPPPPDSIAGWPVIGERLHTLWSKAATDLAGVTQQFAPQLKAMSLSLLGKVAGAGMDLLIFIVALIIAGIFMAYGDSGYRSAVEVASRVFGSHRAVHITELCTATIRAVALGVVGIAFIQMLLIGIGFVVMGIPGAGLLALAVLILGIVQIPATVITLPVIIFVFAKEGASVATIVFAIYELVAGLADNVLKPLLLGRGVDVPMPVVLIGALGGMVTGGIIGLFIGPVVLAIGYELFWQWVRDRSQDDFAAVDAQPLAASATPPIPDPQHKV